MLSIDCSQHVCSPCRFIVLQITSQMYFITNGLGRNYAVSTGINKKCSNKIIYYFKQLGNNSGNFLM